LQLRIHTYTYVIHILILLIRDGSNMAEIKIKF